jgi:hypothetical protein
MQNGDILILTKGECSEKDKEYGKVDFKQRRLEMR